VKHEELKEAVLSGHKASSLLAEVLMVLSEDHYCPEAIGFEGVETYQDCTECIVCIAKQLKQHGDI
jgi:hypothetical protein